MKTRLLLPLVIIFLITCLTRSVSTDITSHKTLLEEPATITQEKQKKMIWHYYQAGPVDTPWILVQRQKLPSHIPAPYYGGFEINGMPLKNVPHIVATCPHNKGRCTTFYIAQAHGFTTPRKFLKGNDYEWVKVRDITMSSSPLHGTWAHTRSGQEVLICPMLVMALRTGQKIR